MNKYLSLILLTALSAFVSTARDADDQLGERLNPVIEAGEDIAVDYSAYPSVRLRHNVVNLNNDDWSALGRKYRSALAGDSLFIVVYLGDSHVQADFGGSVLRRRLSQNRPAGRGLLIPFRLAGTNEPLDYTFKLKSAYTASKLMRSPWSIEMPFTGIALKPEGRDFTFCISSATPADCLRFHTLGSCVSVRQVLADGVEQQFGTYMDSDGLLCMSLPTLSNSFEISLSGDGDTVFGGVELRSDSVGVVFHSIGNNGATFSDYGSIGHFGAELSALHPDLVVVALGTNEAFGRKSTDDLRTNMDALLKNIARYNPGAKILLVGPADCYKKIRRRRRGRRRTVQVVNTKAAAIARTMRLFAEEKGIPYYNQYAVAGSAASQRKAHLLGSDGVHYTAAGYRLWGNLLSDAILDGMKMDKE